jgi:hypothetical protein
MDVERFDGTKERREYETAPAMMADAERESQDPRTKKLTLHFPKPRLALPKGKRRAR